MFAPGYAGELTQVIPTELAGAVWEETGTRERRLSSLPSRVGVYFVLALGLFEHLGARLVWGELVAGLAAAVPQTSEQNVGACPGKAGGDTADRWGPWSCAVVDVRCGCQACRGTMFTAR
ncbi:transposase domain-containing protein [Streptomyces sp. NPDC004542]|uniref:transposase domain-containing protein n=1 Tax=Streptomyces sp. NPDC004542 TaxID=3154281 RepID=UPI0033B0469F